MYQEKNIKEIKTPPLQSTSYPGLLTPDLCLTLLPMPVVFPILPLPRHFGVHSLGTFWLPYPIMQMGHLWASADTIREGVHLDIDEIWEIWL